MSTALDTPADLAHTGSTARVGGPERGGVHMWWLYVLVPVVVLVLLYALARRRGRTGGSPGDAPYDASAAALQTSRQFDKGGMWG
jgi:hypothetical protein